MPKIYDRLTAKEAAALDEMRRWALAQGEVKERIIGKLQIVQKSLSELSVTGQNTWKLNALGVLFGDALQQRLGSRMAWVVAEDESGRAYALRWNQSDLLIYPLSAIKSRLESAEALDVQALFDEYLSMFPARAI